MDGALAIIALFFVIGIVFGAVIVVAVSNLRRDVGPPDGPDDPPGYGPPGPGGPLRTWTGMTGRAMSPEKPKRTLAGSPTDGNSGRRAGA